MIWLSVKRDFFMEPPRERPRQNSTSEVSQSVGGLPDHPDDNLTNPMDVQTVRRPIPDHRTVR